jgi:hypothetical protein
MNGRKRHVRTKKKAENHLYLTVAVIAEWLGAERWKWTEFVPQPPKLAIITERQISTVTDRCNSSNLMTQSEMQSVRSSQNNDFSPG